MEIREIILKALYEAHRESGPYAEKSLIQWIKESGIPKNQFVSEIEYLKDKGLISTEVMGYARITTAGIDLVENPNSLLEKYGISQNINLVTIANAQDSIINIGGQQINISNEIILESFKKAIEDIDAPKEEKDKMWNKVKDILNSRIGVEIFKRFIEYIFSNPGT